jgi:hypothetical protein
MSCETIAAMNYPTRHLCVVITAFIALPAVMACDRREPRMSEQEISELQTFAPGMTAACIEKARFGGLNAISSLPVEECYQMAPARRLRGQWRNDFEGSRFCPEPMKECGYDTPGDDIWLSLSEDLQPPRSWPEVGDGGMFEIEFVGRLTAKRGHYAHFGMSDHEVVVDRVISIRTLPGPDVSNASPQPPSGDARLE